MSFHDILLSPGFWGLSGALIWAGPEWIACTFSDGNEPRLKCTLEFVIRLLTGVLAAIAFTPWMLEMFHNASDRIQPIAATIGLVANKAAPKVVDALASKATRILKGDLK